MRIRIVIGVLVGAFMVLASVLPAAVQGAKVDIAGAYQFLQLLDEGGGSSVPAGWEFSGASRKKSIATPSSMRLFETPRLSVEPVAAVAKTARSVTLLQAMEREVAR